MADSVSLSNSVRANLLTLQKTSAPTNRAAAKDAASVVDEAVSYFQGKSQSAPSGIGTRNDTVDQSVGSVQAAITGLEAIEKRLAEIQGGAGETGAAAGAAAPQGAVAQPADKLSLADLNEEGANLIALQTRQQLGAQSLSFAGQQEQSVLNLFR